MTSRDENRLVEFWTVLSDKAPYLFTFVLFTYLRYETERGL